MWVPFEQVENQEIGGKHVGHFWAGGKIKKMAGNMWVTSEQMKNQERGGKHVDHSGVLSMGETSQNDGKKHGRYVMMRTYTVNGCL